VNRPLSECILVAFFRPAPYWEIPTPAMVEFRPEDELKMLAKPGGTISDQAPVYELASQEPDQPVLRFGFNSMSINAQGPAYTGWVAFLEHTVKTLQAMEEIFKMGDVYEPLMLQYVDVFELEDAKGLRALSELLTEQLRPEKLHVEFKHDVEVEGVATNLWASYQLKASDTSPKLIAKFGVEANLPRIGRSHDAVVTWLNNAHVLSKKLFWDALEDDNREVLADLFSEAEVSLFTGWTLGEHLPELRIAYD